MQQGCRERDWYAGWIQMNKKKRTILDRAFYLIGTRGFEPPAFCSRSRRATRLRYAPNFGRAERCA